MSLSRILERLSWFESIVTSAPVWCVVYDPDTDQFLYANPAMVDAVGQVVGRSYRDLVIERDIDSTTDEAARTLAGWLDVWREAVRDGDFDAACAAKRQVLEAEAQLDRARRAHDNAAQWARVERRASLFRG